MKAAVKACYAEGTRDDGTTHVRMVRIHHTGFNGDSPGLAAGRVRLPSRLGRFPRLYLFFEPLGQGVNRHVLLDRW